jgi:uncharacterized cupin superfamily protein
MPKIDLAALPEKETCYYPAVFAHAVRGRHIRRPGKAGGLTQFGVNVVRLEAGAWSSLRHWHEKEDEFVMVLEGELVLVEDAGETLLKAGDMAAFPANSGNGHHMLNRTDSDAVFLVIGTDSPEERIHYPGLDLAFEAQGGREIFTRRDGTPY